jgi:intraflagellar transport protein 74
LKQYVQILATKHDGKRAQLHDNETFSQLAALEQRLRHHESNNFHLKDYIHGKTAESDYRSVAFETADLMEEINNQLGKILSLPPAHKV